MNRFDAGARCCSTTAPQASRAWEDCRAAGRSRRRPAGCLRTGDCRRSTDSRSSTAKARPRIIWKRPLRFVMSSGPILSLPRSPWQNGSASTAALSLRTLTVSSQKCSPCSACNGWSPASPIGGATASFSTRNVMPSSLDRLPVPELGSRNVQRFRRLLGSDACLRAIAARRCRRGSTIARQRIHGRDHRQRRGAGHHVAEPPATRAKVRLGDQQIRIGNRAGGLVERWCSGAGRHLHTPRRWSYHNWHHHRFQVGQDKSPPGPMA